ncbi:hypothetical protein QR680_012034 [Steinernema hermaphroditum]|uniref:EGF-like domain-containing protein n=1 Tax=Steinernema hermaphroditum TaxID=289476 RepID=A0AA39I3C7_9BILA|nr:hypothetical protein QR680_012034 [Steinernema hermaphroditum]
MFSRLFLLACLVAGTVAFLSCLNGGTPTNSGNEWRPCHCPADYTGRYCGIPTRNSDYYLVTTLNYKRFTFEDFRNKNLTIEPPYSTDTYKVSMTLESDDGTPIEFLVEHLDPTYDQLCSMGFPEIGVDYAVKLNGVGYECADLYHKVHKSQSGKFLLEIFLINHSERHDITVLAKKAVPPYPVAVQQ